MIASRRFQVLPPVGYCEACGEGFTSEGSLAAVLRAVEAAAAGHADRTGHETRVMRTHLIIITPGEEVASDG